MVLMLYLHPSVAARVRKPERLEAKPHATISEYTDVYGNRCGRVLVGPGLAAFSNDAVVEDDGRPDPQVPDAYQHGVQDLPDNVLLFLLASRYCEVDRLKEVAWDLFGGLPPGWPRCRRCATSSIPTSASTTMRPGRPTALDVYLERAGVCRDFMHLADHLLPLPDDPGPLLPPATWATSACRRRMRPMDFSAWFEVFLGGEWHAFDARHNVPRVGRVLMARGRDAADVALTTTFGVNQLHSFHVVTEEVSESFLRQ